MKTDGFQGATFGIMEGIIMVLGIITGLSVLKNRSIFILSILIIGISDAFANSAAFHVSEETETVHHSKEIWKSTIFCFFGTLITFAIMAIPSLLIHNVKAIIIITWLLGISLVVLTSCIIIKVAHRSKWVILEYVSIAIVVSILCYYLGNLIHAVI